MLDVRDIHKAYGELPALRGVSLRADAGAIVALLGPSGCGKTTLLRIIAGLEQADRGEIWFERQRIDDLPSYQRDFGLMFQDYALFPHLDVAANVAFGLRMHGLERAAIAARVAEMLELVGLRGYERRRVYELSGGERQRVALARSLAPRPRLLMLDEPLAALDRTLRERLLDELRLILRQVGVTGLYVTHDQGEAFAIADWLVLMHAGQIEQQGPPEQVYHQPESRFAAQFFGLANLLPASVRSVHAGIITLDTAVGELAADAVGMGVANGEHLTVVVRPEAAMVAEAPTSGANHLAGKVIDRSFRGSTTRLTMQSQSGDRLTFVLDEPNVPQIGEPIVVRLRPRYLSLIREARGGER